MSLAIHATLDSRVTDRQRTNTRLAGALRYAKVLAHVHHEFVDVRSKKAADKRLSPAGRAEDMRQHAVKSTLPAVIRARRVIAKIEDQHKAQREQWTPRPKVAKDFAGAVDAQMRLFLLQRLLTLDPAQQVKELVNPNVDRRLVEAVVDVPTWTHSIPQAVIDRVVDELVDREHGPDVERLADEAEVADALRAACDAVIGEVRSSLEFPHEKAFNEFVAETSAGVGEPTVAEMSVPEFEAHLHDKIDAALKPAA